MNPPEDSPNATPNPISHQHMAAPNAEPYLLNYRPNLLVLI
jgi:hypothetical protein